MSATRKNFGVPEALGLLAKGAIVTAYVVIPGLAVAGKYVMDVNDWIDQQESNKNIKTLKDYNHSKLRQTFTRLHKQKDVKIINKNGQQVVRLTQKGKQKWVKYKLEEMKLDKSNWDGKWRLITYDIPVSKGVQARKLLRSMLLRLSCKQLHKSVYLTPFNCKDEIDYLREVFGIGEDVVVMEVSKIEGEQELKREFGLK